MNKFQDLLKLICEGGKAQMTPDEINDDTRIIEDLYYDSIELITLITRIEEKYDCIIDYDQMDFSLLETVGGIKSIYEKCVLKSAI